MGRLAVVISNLVDLLPHDDGVVFADLLLAVHAVVERAAVLVTVAVQGTEQALTAAREACGDRTAVRGPSETGDMCVTEIGRSHKCHISVSDHTGDTGQPGHRSHLSQKYGTGPDGFNENTVATNGSSGVTRVIWGQTGHLDQKGRLTDPAGGEEGEGQGEGQLTKQLMSRSHGHIVPPT